jgi:hypothetical protein
MDDGMLLVTVNELGIVFCAQVGGYVEEIEQTADTALFVLGALAKQGFEVSQMLVIDTSVRVNA